MDKAFVDHEQDLAEALCKEQNEILAWSGIETMKLYGALFRGESIFRTPT